MVKGYECKTDSTLVEYMLGGNGHRRKRSERNEEKSRKVVGRQNMDHVWKTIRIYGKYMDWLE